MEIGLAFSFFLFYPITQGVLMFAASSCPINEKLLCVRYTNNMLMCGVFNPFIL